MVPTPDNKPSERSLRSSSRDIVEQKLNYIRNKIQKHLDGEKKMNLGVVNKTAAALKKLESKVDGTKKSFVSAAKNILSRIRKELVNGTNTHKIALNSTEEGIGWRTRGVQKFLKLDSLKTTQNKCKSILGSLPNSSLPNTFPLELLTDDNKYITQQQVQECDVPMDQGLSSSPAATILKNITDEKEQMLTTDNDTETSLVIMNSNFSQEIPDHMQNSAFQESKTAQTSIKADTDLHTFDAQLIPTELPPEQGSSTSTSSMQISSTSTFGNSTTPEDIPFQNYTLISPLQQSQPSDESSLNPQSFNAAKISNEPSLSPMSIKFISNANEQMSPTSTDTQLNSLQIGFKSQISNFEESQTLELQNIEITNNPHPEAFEVEKISNDHLETSQLNNFESNFKSSVNIISHRVRRANVSSAPSHASNWEDFENYLKSCGTDDLISDFEGFQQEGISDEKYRKLNNFHNLEDKEGEEVVIIQEDPQNISNSESYNLAMRTDAVIIYEDQKLISSEASGNQTTNPFCFTLPSQTNEWEANILKPQPVKEISFQADSGISRQSSEIIPGTLPTYYFDANVPSPGNKMTPYFVINNMTESQQTNSLDAYKPVQEKMDQSVIWLEVSFFNDHDMDLTDAGDNNIVEGDNLGDDQSKENTNAPVPETQESFVFGMSKPASPNNNVFPAEQLSITETRDKFRSQDTETIIPETIYTQSQRFDSNSPRIKSPYKNSTSSGCLIYKATRKSQASLAKPKRSESQQKKMLLPSTSSSTPSGDTPNLTSNASSLSQNPSRNIFHYTVSESSSNQENRQNTIVEVTSQPPELQSQNIMLINGCLPENSNSQDHNEVLYSEREEKLVEKVMKRRERYTDEEWKELPMTVKVSGTYADKFHVRIFDDPVEALTNIRYEPCFSTFYFPRLTLRQVLDGLTKVVNDSRKMDSVLTSIVDNLEDKNLALNFPKRLGNTDKSDVSDSSDEEGKSNEHWLREYKAKMMAQRRCLMVEPEKEKPYFTSRRGPMLEIEWQKTEEERDEVEMVDLMAKFEACDWLKEEHEDESD